MQIRYYAGAAETAGTHEEELGEGDLTRAELVNRLGSGRERLAAVLDVSTLLVDGTPLVGDEVTIPAQARVDVLPPFAGG